MSRQALLADAAKQRETAALLERSAEQNEKLAELSVSEFGAGPESDELIADAKAMRTQASYHRSLATQSEWEAGPEFRPSTICDEQRTQPTAEIGPLLTTAAAAAATVLPGGWALGAAAVTAAPYLGYDPDGTARQYVQATLTRDPYKRAFGLLLKEDDEGVYIAALMESSAEDERAKLRVGDRVRALNDAMVVNRSAASPATASSHDQDAQLPPLTLDEAKELVRGCAETIRVQVLRREVRPAADRLIESKDKVMGDVQKVWDAAKASPHFAPHIERVEGALAPHLENVRPHQVAHWQREDHERRQRFEASLATDMIELQPPRQPSAAYLGVDRALSVPPHFDLPVAVPHVDVRLTVTARPAGADADASGSASASRCAPAHVTCQLHV